MAQDSDYTGHVRFFEPTVMETLADLTKRLYVIEQLLKPYKLVSERNPGEYE